MTPSDVAARVTFLAWITAKLPGISPKALVLLWETMGESERLAWKAAATAARAAEENAAE